MAGVKGRSGRKARTVETRELKKTLAAAAKQGVRLLFVYLKGKDEHGNKVKPLSGTKLEAIKLAIAHTIGTPRQAVDLHHTGDQLTLKELAMLAQSSESLLQNADKSDEKDSKLAEKTEEDVVNIPTKPLSKTVKTEKN